MSIPLYEIGEPNKSRFIRQFGISLVDLIETFLKLPRYPLSAVSNDDAQELQSFVWELSADFCFVKPAKNIVRVFNRLEPVT